MDHKRTGVMTGNLLGLAGEVLREQRREGNLRQRHGVTAITSTTGRGYGWMENDLGGIGSSNGCWADVSAGQVHGGAPHARQGIL